MIITDDKTWFLRMDWQCQFVSPVPIVIVIPKAWGDASMWP